MNTDIVSHSDYATFRQTELYIQHYRAKIVEWCSKEHPKKLILVFLCSVYVMILLDGRFILPAQTHSHSQVALCELAV